MKSSRIILTTSLLLNALLLAAAGWGLTKPGIVSPPVSHVVQRKILSQPPVVVTNSGAVAGVLAAAPFHWSQVESTNYEVYVANLRAIGCPEPTIRDIISADIREVYLAKTTEILDPLRRQFWPILAAWRVNEEHVEAEFKGIEKLDTECRELVDKLLGPLPTREAEDNGADDQRYGFLPEGKREQLAALEKKYRDDRARLSQENNGGQKPHTREEFATLKREFERARKEAMTPEEFEESRLRSSDSASFRFNAYFGGCSETEMRALVKAGEDFKAARTSPAGTESDLERQHRIARLNAEQEQQIRSVLGPERFADYQRAADNDFQQVFQVTQRYELPRDAAVQVYELRKSAADRVAHWNADGDVSEEERDGLVEALRQDVRKAVTGALGEGATATYLKHGGAWLDQLDNDD